MSGPDETTAPGHVPAGMQFAAGYRYIRDALRTALELPEDELRDLVAQISDGMDDLARSFDHQPEGTVVGTGYRSIADGLRTALRESDDTLREVVEGLAEGLDALANGMDPLGGETEGGPN